MTGWGTSPWGGGTGFAEPPSIINVVPADGQVRRRTVIQFDMVTTDSLPFTGVSVEYPDGTQTTIFDGESFSAGFTESGSVNTRVAITHGYRFYVRPDEGWLAAPTIRPTAVDTRGKLARVPG